MHARHPWQQLWSDSTSLKKKKMHGVQTATMFILRGLGALPSYLGRYIVYLALGPKPPACPLLAGRAEDAECNHDIPNKEVRSAAL